MQMRKAGFQGLIAAALALSLGGCARVPAGWRIETGRARVVDDIGERTPRMQAIEAARLDARVKLLRYVEAMPASPSNLVGDYVMQDAMVGVRVRSLILSARQFATRYHNNGTVEVDMGIDPQEAHRVVRETKP